MMVSLSLCEILSLEFCVCTLGFNGKYLLLFHYKIINYPQFILQFH